MAPLGWRNSHIRTSRGGFVVVPNQRLAISVLINFTLPTGEIGHLIALSITASSDLERVEAITLEVANEVLRVVQDTKRDLGPAIRF